MTHTDILSFPFSYRVNRSVYFTYITLLILTAMLLVVGLSSPASALTGTGTAIDPYLISTADDLDEFRDIVNGGQNDAWGVLTQDIDMSRLSDEAERENWTPIGYFIDEDTVDETAYVGTFDGREYKIINLKINRPDDNYVGLFGIISTKGRVRKINVSGTIVGNNYVGGIVGHNFVEQYSGKSGGSIVDCNAIVSVTGNSDVGGIVGYNDGLLKKCSNDGNVTGASCVGGIVGLSYYNDGRIMNCTNTGTVTGSDSSIGGIAGSCDEIIANCNNTGNVTCTMSSWSGGVGGVVGNLDGTMTNCSNSGEVTSAGSYVGGVVGKSQVESTIDNCSNDGTVVGNSDVGGIIGYLRGWDITVSNCNNSGTVIGNNTEEDSNTGGIVGSSDDDQNNVTNCVNSGNISGISRVGGIMGYCVNSLTNCKNLGEITGINYIGGIAGYGSWVSRIISCLNSGIVTGKSKWSYVGGIAGQNNGRVTNCANIGAVTGNQYTAGIVGYNYGVDDNEGVVTNCSNSGNITGNSWYTGGVVAENYTGTVTNCSNSGTITAIETDGLGIIGVGAVVGSNWYDGIVTNCGWLQGTCSTGIGGNNDGGAVTNVIQFSAEQLSSVITTAIPNIDKTILYKDKDNIQNTATISFTTYPSQPSDRFNEEIGFMRDIWARANSVYYNNRVIVVSTNENNSGTVVIRGQKDGSDTVEVHADLYATDFSSIGNYVADELYLTLNYYVTPIIPLDGITLSTKNINIALGNSKEISVIYNPEEPTNTTVSWTCSNPALMTVEPTNTNTAKITAFGLSDKPITVTATAEDGNFTASCEVTVVPSVTGVSLSSSSLELELGETAQLTATIHPAEAIDYDLSWENSNRTVASHSSSGNMCTITANKLGSTIITANIDNGKHMISCQVKVNLKTIILNEYGAKHQIIPISGSNHIYNSSDPNIVSLSQDGIIMAIAGGTAIITVTSEDGDYSDTYLVVVEETPLMENTLKGSGTDDNPYLIDSADELAQFKDIVNSGYQNACGVLTQDIDLSQLSNAAERENWTPIGYSPDGDETTAYMGTFDGQGYTISNLKINRPEENNIGLFGCVYTDGVIKNLAVSGTVTGYEYVGGVVGDNNGTILNCNNSGTVNGTDYGVGGIAGYNNGNSQIINCNNSGDVIGEGRSVGGITGYNSGIVTNCTNVGNVSGASNTGGISGGNSGYDYYGSGYQGCVTNSNNFGTITGMGENVGGIMGYNNGVISNSTSSNTVTGTNNVGGVVGNNDGTVTNCSNSGEVSGAGDSVGGIAGYCLYSDTINCTNSGFVTSTGNNTGGIVGYSNNRSDIWNCSNLGAVSGTGDYIGGVVGRYHSGGTVRDCCWLEDAHSVGIGGNGTGANVVQFNTEQQASVVTTAIPSIDKTILNISKDEAVTISFKTYLSEPEDCFDSTSGFMRNIQATSDSAEFEIDPENGTVKVIPTKGGLAEVTITADLYSTDFASIGSYVTEPVQVEFVYYIDVVVPLEGIFLSETDITLAPDSSTKLSVIFSPEDATNKAVTWISSNPELVKIEPTVINSVVKIAALQPTSMPVVITATTIDGNYTATAYVNVISPTKSIVTKIITECGQYPDYCTLLTGSPDSTSVIEYPGTVVSEDGTVSKTILSQDSDYYLGVSLLNSLVSGMEVSPDVEDFTDSPLYMIEGDLNNDNVIDGTDYTILVQRMHYDSGIADHGLVGDLNYDGIVDDQDLMFFNSPVTHTGEPRFMQKGYDMSGDSVTTAANSHTAKRSSALQIEPFASGSYEVSFKEATEPANMLQLSLTGDIYNTVPNLPNGYELIGEHYDDDRTVVAIGNTAKEGVSIPAGTPILSVQSVSEPRIDYTHSTLQKVTEDGVVDLPLTGGSSSLIDVPTPAAPVRQPSSDGSSGCNTGLGVFALLTAVPLFFTRKR